MNVFELRDQLFLDYGNFVRGVSSQDSFPAREVDFMLSKLPCGENPVTGLEPSSDKCDMRDLYPIERIGDQLCRRIACSMDSEYTNVRGTQLCHV
jgi:hypothetical protein